MLDRLLASRAPFRVYRQHDLMDCGPSCLRMIARHHGRHWSLSTLRERCQIGRGGVSMEGIAEAAESIGLRSLALMLDYEQLSTKVPLPCIAHWDQNHFVVIVAADAHQVRVADPARGQLRLSREEFVEHWRSRGSRGVVLLLEPTPAFLEHRDEARQHRGLGALWPYLVPHRRLLVQLVLGMVVASLLGLVFPFLTQALVDVGIGAQDLGFVHAVLLAQLMLFGGRTAVELIRSWILLHIGQRANIGMLTDFLSRMMRLPLAFFDTRTIGDVLQRVDDHRRIERFLTAGTLEVLFSVVNVVVFALVIAAYSRTVLVVFLVGTAAAVAWILLFMRRRRQLDQLQFAQRSASQSALVELVEGIAEIKLGGCERRKRWDWERIQVRLHRINERRLALSQIQQAGSLALNEGKNIIVTFLAAREVIDGSMTLGMMLAVTWVMGQVGRPLDRLLGFVQSAQDTVLGLERLGEVHAFPEEQPADQPSLRELGPRRELRLAGVSFRYPGGDGWVLRDVELTIPEGKTTAIVGASGSGKTTLLKLLLGFYEPGEGEILVGGVRLANLHRASWRRRCGVVMQDGHIFAVTIAGNVAVGDEEVDLPRLLESLEVANLRDFVEGLPLAWQTRIGRDGQGLSQGQRQRILIARALYHDPEYLFFDEATSSLDATNERVIMDKLDQVVRGRTSVVIAHRLSTVRNADQIVVLDRGRVVERGTHDELTASRGAYYRLVKNQLELGS